uniref:Fatty acyl-CoA reductase n=1 Tax=Musca domestica TaxID=7370 RepID=T1PI25_MUSDO
MDIAEFYNNREIFITGGTGYLGKSLIEKLLRDCEGIKTLYMLIRPKRGKTALERLNDFKNDSIFERVRRERPNVFDKVVPIFGDCQDIGLGISQEDLNRLKNVSILFHGAAFVKFDNDLRSSILMNTRGTYELVKIALTLKQLIAFVHISTAYIYPEGNYIEEKIYKLPNDWRTAIKLAETFDVNSLDILRLKYTNFYPNPYSFTKNLSEQIVADHSDALPVTIIRPAVVSPSYLEPEPGYLDNLNGPMGVLAIVALGVCQMSYTNPDLKLALIPVDMVTCLTIASACQRGLEILNKPKNAPLELRIQTFAPVDLFPFTLLQSAKKMVEIIKRNPIQNSVWAPSIRMTTNMYLYFVWLFLVHIPMAIFYDALLIISKKKPMLLQANRKIFYAVRTLGKFSKKYFEFQNDGMWNVLKFTLEHDENRRFYVVDPKDLDFHHAFEALVCGLKKHIFKEPLEATAATRQRFKMFVLLDKSIKLLLFLIVVRCLWKWTY